MAFWDKLFKRKESATVTIKTGQGSTGIVWPERGYDNFSRETYLKNVTAFSAIGEVARSGASVPWKVFERNPDNTRSEVEDPLNQVLKRANPEESFAFVLMKVLAYLVMCGNAFKEKVVLEGGPNKGQVRELYSHRPDRFTLDVAEGRLRKYIYTVNSRKTEWEVDPITRQSNILQLKTFHPLNDWWGAAATESAAREIDTSNASTEWNKALLDNQGRPGMVFTLVGQLGEKSFDQLEKYLESRSGPSNAGKDIIITGERGTGVAPYGWSPTDMDFSQGDIRMMRKIAMAYGVPPELLGIESSTFNNRSEARLFFWENTVVWWLNYIRGELNNWLFPLDSKRFIDYDLNEVPAFSEKRNKLWQRAQDSDFLSINEKREMVGKPDWGADGDVILVEASKIPLGMETESEKIRTEETAKKHLLEQGYSEDEIEDMLGLKQYDDYEVDDEPDESKPYPNEFS